MPAHPWRYGSHAVNKIDFARYLRGLARLPVEPAARRVAASIIFDDEVSNYVPPSAGKGSSRRMLHAIEKAKPGTRTDFAKPFFHFQQFLHRRGIIVVVSDFYEDPETISRRPWSRCGCAGTKSSCFMSSIRRRSGPVKDPALVLDMETEDTIEVTPDYVSNEYRA